MFGNFSYLDGKLLENKIITEIINNKKKLINIKFLDPFFEYLYINGCSINFQLRKDKLKININPKMMIKKGVPSM